MGVPLHVEVHIGSPLREAWRGQLDPTAHDNNRLPTQTAGAADLQQRQIGVRADGDECRPGVEAALEEAQCSTRWRRPGHNACRPVPLINDRIGPGESGGRDFRSGR
jgi:hypothetical protein